MLIFERIKRVVHYSDLYRKKIAFFVSYDRSPDKLLVLKMIERVRREVTLCLHSVEALQLFTSVKNTQKIPGDIAEVGAYKGGSSKIICEAKGDRNFYVFDNFEGGLPEVDGVLDPAFFKGQFDASYDEAKKYLSPYKNTYVYKGIFPQIASPVLDKKFSFVHLDVDTYKSTKDCLEFFYSRMNQGGILISHDYISPGVKKAFNEFFADKIEPIIELPQRQCMFVKC